MKKTLITVFVVLLFTLFFVLVFRYTSGASSVDIENGESFMTEEKTESTENEIENASEDTSSTGEAVDSATEKKLKREETKAYIKEKIVPVVIGVLTSVSAILATLGAIKRALSSIGETKELFKSESKKRDEKFQKESEYLTKKAEKIESALALIPHLENEVATLEKNTTRLLRECRDLGKMLSLGFSQDERVISSGNGQKISRLLEGLEEPLSQKETEANV